MRPFISAAGLVLSTSLLSQEPGTDNGELALGPIMVPEPVGFSFDAPGWYVLLTLIGILAVYTFVKWLIQYRKNAYRRAALKELSKINNTVELLILLKRVSMKAYSRAELASLSGNDWFIFLESTGKDTPFTNFKNIIYGAVYRDSPIESSTLEEISTLSKRWIKTHA